MPKKIGLEIGSSKTKIVVGNIIKGKFHVSEFKIIDTLDGVFSIDGEIDILKMEFAIKEALSELKVKNAELYVSINNEKIIIRTRELPRVAVKEMLDIVRFEAENFLPYNIEEFYIDYKVLSEIAEHNFGESDNNEILFNVMIIAAPKEIVDQYIQLASNLKLKLKLTTVYTESVNRYISKYVLEEKKNVLFVDIGANTTNMIMYQGQQYFANIKAENGVEKIKERLVDNHGFSDDDVQFQLFQFGDRKDNTISEPKDRLEIFKTTITKENKSQSDSKLHILQKKLEKIRKIKTTMDAPESEIVTKRNSEYQALVKEINRMVEFFKSRKYGTYVDKIYLLGGGAYLKDFMEFLIDELGIESSLLPRENFNTDIDSTAFELILPAIGACIGGKS